jgi:hypothetical protein
MWHLWFLTCIHNCVSIFWFIVKNEKNAKNPKMIFNGQTKHVFWQDYFMHMWLAPKARHFEPIEHHCFAKWLKKWIHCLMALSFKISRFWNFCMIWVFIKFTQWTCIFIRKRHVFVVQKVWNQLNDSIHSFWLFFKTMQFEHLM